MNDKENYNQLVLNLARHAVDLALECNYHRNHGAGEPTDLNKHPDTKQKMKQFQPPLGELDSALFASPDEKRAAAALQAILAAMAQLLR